MNVVILRVMLFMRNKRRTITFLLIGGSLFILNLTLQFLLKEKLHIDPRWTNIYVTIFLYILQFVFNAIFTWGDRSVGFRQNVKRVCKYVPIKIVLWVANTAIDLFLLSIGLHYQLANAIAVLLIMTINYFVFDRIIFTK